ncbi:MAG: oligosaccharide flippase family protein [Flavobacteriales bacterium]|nr:oligosaccharide flippase family protein [Flavobacteriales bacterium]
MKQATQNSAIWSVRKQISAHPILSKLFSSSFATGLNFVSKWLFNFVLSKQLSNSSFGLFSVLYAFGNLFMNALSFGGSLHMIHAVSADKSRKYKALGLSVQITSIFLAGALTLAFIWSLIPGLSAPEGLLVAVLFGGINAYSAVLFSFFKGLGQFYKEAIGFFFFAIAMGVALLLIAFFNWPDNPTVLLSSLCAVSAIPLLYGIVKLNTLMKSENVPFGALKSTEGFKEFWKEKRPFGLHEIQGAIYTHINIILLAFLLSSSDLGIFKSVQLLIVPVSILPSIFSQVALNKLSSNMKSDKFKPLFRKFLIGTSILGGLIFLVFVLFGDSVITWIYQDKLQSAPLALLILCFSGTFLLKFISSNYGILITAAGNQKFRVKITLASIIVSVALTLGLGYFWGMMGAAIAMVASNALILVAYAYYGELFILKKSTC